MKTRNLERSSQHFQKLFVRKTKVLELLTKVIKLAETPNKSSPNFLETASDTIEELDTIVKKGALVI